MGLGTVIRELGVKVSLLFDKKSATEAHNKIEDLSDVLRKTSLRVAEVSATLLGLAKVASSNSRELANHSEILGVNVEKLQELEYAAKVAADVGREELMGSLEGISKALYEARRGNVDALYSINRLGLGLDVMADSTISADQVLVKLADRLKYIQNPMTKMAVLSSIGISPKMIPLLNKGSDGIAKMSQEARNLGLVLSSKTIAQGKAFDEQLSKMWMVIKNVSFVLGHEMMRYLGPLVTEWSKFIVQNKKLISSGLAMFLKSVSNYVMIIFKTMRFLVERIKFLVSVMGGLERVTKIVAIALAAITSAKIIAGIGGVISAGRGLLALFSMLSIESLAIGAGILALILVVQDLFSKDSIIKEWFNLFKKEFPGLAGFAQGFVDTMVAGAKLIAEGWSNVWSWIAPIKEFLTSDTVVNTVKSIGSAIESIAKWNSEGHIGSAIADVVDYVGNIGSAKTAVATPSASAAYGNNAVKNNLEANITVQVPNGTSAKDATGIVSGGVQDAFDSLFRQTHNQATGGIAY